MDLEERVDVLEDMVDELQAYIFELKRDKEHDRQLFLFIGIGVLIGAVISITGIMWWW